MNEASQSEARKEDRFLADKAEVANAWLCGESVDWKPVSRAAEFVLATQQDPELKMSRLAAIVGGAVALAAVPLGWGIATFAAAAAGYGGVYVGAIFGMVAARREAFRILSKAGFEWSERVKELGGQGQERLLRKIGIQHEVAMAVESSQSWTREGVKNEAFALDPKALKGSAMGALCLRLATRWGAMIWAGKGAKTIRLQALGRVDGEAMGQALFPMRLAQLEGEQIEREMEADSAPRRGPKRM